MWRLNVTGVKVDLPHHRPSEQRRGPSCRVMGGRHRGGVTTAQRACLPTQQAKNGAGVAAMEEVPRAKPRQTAPRRGEEEVSSRPRRHGSTDLHMPKTGG